MRKIFIVLVIYSIFTFLNSTNLSAQYYGLPKVGPDGQYSGCKQAYSYMTEAENYLRNALQTDDIDDLETYLTYAKRSLSNADFHMMNCNMFMTKSNMQSALRNVRNALNEKDIENKYYYAKRARNDLNSAFFFMRSGN